MSGYDDSTNFNLGRQENLEETPKLSDQPVQRSKVTIGRPEKGTDVKQALQRLEKVLQEGSCKSYLPISLTLAEAVLDRWEEDMVPGWDSLSNQVQVAAACRIAMFRVPQRASLVLSTGYNASRVYDEETGKELRFWVNRAALDGFQPLDPAGYLELCAYAFTERETWESMTQETSGRPSIVDILGIF